jgi:hypothetical protein
VGPQAILDGQANGLTQSDGPRRDLRLAETTGLVAGQDGPTDRDDEGKGGPDGEDRPEDG